MTIEQAESLRSGPDNCGHFGLFGGRYVPETLMPLILQLESVYGEARQCDQFQSEMAHYLKNYVG